jgi:hypothetical protein
MKYLAGLLLCYPLAAQPKTVEIRAMIRGQHLYVKVLSYNPSPKWQSDLKLHLECRLWGVGPWLPLRYWKSLGKLGPSQRNCREYFSPAPWPWPKLQLRARLQGAQVSGLDQTTIQ